MDKTIEDYVSDRDQAQAELEKKVTREFPVGCMVAYKGVRGDTQGDVTGHDGEMLIIGGKMKRHFAKVEKIPA